MHRTWLNARLGAGSKMSLSECGGGVGFFARKRLQSLLQCKAEEAIAAWKKRVQTLLGACRWIKAKEPPPRLLESSDAETGARVLAVGQAPGAGLRRRAWDRSGYTTPIAPFTQRYEVFRFFAPAQSECPLPDLP